LQGEFSTDSFAFRSKLSGDFYHEPDDVVRGVTISGHDMGFGLVQSYDGCRFNKFDHLAGSSYPRTEFDSTDVPPCLSEEVKTYLEATTLSLSDYSPITVGNTLLTFLREVVDARVSKVNLRKFTILAEVVLEGFACAVKIRIYRHERGTIVEFQRRSGDAVAFGRFYRKASGYLQGFPDEQIAPEAGSPQEAPHVPGLLPNEAIAPLLDMVVSCQGAKLLAEAASILSVMIKDPTIAAELRRPCAFSALQQLQNVNDFSVAFPASQVLSCM